MNNDVTEIATLTGVSVAINAVYAIQHGKNAVVTVVAGGFLFISLALVGGITGRYDLARALAAVFLLASALLHGMPLADTAVAISKGAKGTTPASVNTANAANSATINSPHSVPINIPTGPAHGPSLLP
jgi:hypothetical protein